MPDSRPDTELNNPRSAKPPLDPHLKALENEAIHIFREVAAEFERPVMFSTDYCGYCSRHPLDRGWQSDGLQRLVSRRIS